MIKFDLLNEAFKNERHCRGILSTQSNIYDGIYLDNGLRFKVVNYFPEKAPL